MNPHGIPAVCNNRGAAKLCEAPGDIRLCLAIAWANSQAQSSPSKANNTRERRRLESARSSAVAGTVVALLVIGLYPGCRADRVDCLLQWKSVEGGNGRGGKYPYALLKGKEGPAERSLPGRRVICRRHRILDTLRI